MFVCLIDRVNDFGWLIDFVPLQYLWAAMLSSNTGMILCACVFACGCCLCAILLAIVGLELGWLVFSLARFG